MLDCVICKEPWVSEVGGSLPLLKDPCPKTIYARVEVVREKLKCAKNLKEAMDMRPSSHGLDARSYVTLTHSDWEVRSPYQRCKKLFE